MVKSQSGRSMVEMLGVLAIVGVLSIGGIAGYKTAMDMGRANVALADLNFMYVSSSSNNKNQDTYVPSDFNDKTYYPIVAKRGTRSCGAKTCSWELTVSDVPKDVCLRMLNTMPKFHSDACANETNEMEIGFDANGNWAEIGA